jgi:predicted nucleic acid-binding protein
MTTIVDTDAIFALSNRADALHARAKRILERAEQPTLILSPTTIVEVSFTATKKLGLQRAKQVIQAITSGSMRMEMIQEHDVQSATQFFYQQRTKAESLCDCFVMALAKRMQADCIFSFDQGYKKNGFVLIEEFLEQLAEK